MANNPRAEGLNLVVKLTGALGHPPALVEQLMLDLSSIADAAAFAEVCALVAKVAGAQNAKSALDAASVEVEKLPKKAAAAAQK